MNCLKSDLTLEEGIRVGEAEASDSDLQLFFAIPSNLAFPFMDS